MASLRIEDNKLNTLIDTIFIYDKITTFSVKKKRIYQTKGQYIFHSFAQSSDTCPPKTQPLPPPADKGDWPRKHNG